MQTERTQLHEHEVARIARSLRSRGVLCVLTPRTSRLGNPDGDLMVAGRSVAVRVARCSAAHSHAVVSRGKRYVYRYAMAMWNLHNRGRLVAADFLALVVVHDHERRTYVIPRSLITGKTVRALWSTLRSGHHWLARYRDAWGGNRTTS
jgi:hypothetical protein